jgi:hypothetical protein
MQKLFSCGELGDLREDYTLECVKWHRSRPLLRR